MTIYIGIDIGGTKTAGALVSGTGTVIKRVVRSTPALEGGAVILNCAVQLADQLIKEAEKNGENVQAIGVGAGGQIDSEKGYVFSATEVLPGWKGTKIVETFEEKLKIATRVDNDVNVLALGEYRFGAAKHLQDAVNKSATVVFLALGTGVGGALITGGHVHHGAHWSGGEFGHILLSMDDDARIDTGGARGTLEAYCSGPGMVETFRQLSGLADATISGHEVVQAAARENSNGIPDGPGQKAIFMTGRYLGFGLTTLVNALDPDMVIIGGGLAALGQALLGPAVDIIKARALPGPATCPVVVAALGADAALIGAASLVIPGK